MTSRIVTPFTARSTAADVLAGIDLGGRRVLVTGGAAGIGAETARALAGAGAEVTLAARNVEAAWGTAADIAATTGNTALFVRHLDLTDRASVRALAAGWEGPLDILVNNAGIMAPPARQLTSDGHEAQFATNHLGHFALALGLHRALAAARGARVVALSSVGHLRFPVDFDDVDFERRPYDPWAAYGQSKTAASLFAVEATKRWAADGITANAVHPGAVRTRLMRHQGDDYVQRLDARFGGAEHVPWKTVGQGAATSVLVAASPLVEGVGGRYFEDAAEALPAASAPVPGASGVAPHALDPDAALKLWNLSLAMTGAAQS